MKLTGMFEDKPNCTKNGFLNKKNISGGYITKINQKKGRNAVFETFFDIFRSSVINSFGYT